MNLIEMVAYFISVKATTQILIVDNGQRILRFIIHHIRSLNQSCEYRFGLTIAIEYFNTGQYRRSIKTLKKQVDTQLNMLTQKCKILF
jgi:hypothetical protein